jgi:tRNA-dependent cyclodipeptide synthase
MSGHGSFSTVTGRNVIMGVSLANRTFNRAYVRKLFTFIAEAKPHGVYVILGDEIEIINYIVFGGKQVGRARDVARARAQNLGRMFESFSGTLRGQGVSFTWMLESELLASCQMGPEIKTVRLELEKALSIDNRFLDDVDDQVRHNLADRVVKHGQEIINNNISMLRDYILGELAIYIAFWRTYPNVVEIYPGENLFVKEHILMGRYPLLRPPPPGQYEYLNSRLILECQAPTG